MSRAGDTAPPSRSGSIVSEMGFPSRRFASGTVPALDGTRRVSSGGVAPELQKVGRSSAASAHSISNMRRSSLRRRGSSANSLLGDALAWAVELLGEELVCASDRRGSKDIFSGCGTPMHGRSASATGATPGTVTPSTPSGNRHWEGLRSSLGRASGTVTPSTPSGNPGGAAMPQWLEYSKITDTLPDKLKLILLYFSGRFCPLSSEFDEVMKDAYNSLKGLPEGADFELVWVSCDVTEQAYLAHIQSLGGFLGVAWNPFRLDEIAVTYGVDGIPTVMILDALSGRVISADGREHITKQMKSGTVGSSRQSLVPSSAANLIMQRWQQLYSTKIAEWAEEQKQKQEAE